MKPVIQITNATEIFAREPKIWSLGKIPLPKPISSYAFYWAVGFLAPVWLLFTLLEMLLWVPDFGAGLIITAIPAAIASWYLGKTFGEQSERFDGLTLQGYLVQRRHWKNQSRGWLDGSEYDPNMNQTFRIDAPVQVLYLTEEELEQQNTTKKTKTTKTPKNKKGN